MQLKKNIQKLSGHETRCKGDLCVSLWFGFVIVWWISVRMRDCMVARGTTSPHPFSKKRWMTWPAAPIWRMTSSKADGWVKQPRWAIYSLPAFHPSPSLAQFSLSFFIPWIIAALPETLFQREQDWFIRHGFRKDSGVCVMKCHDDQDFTDLLLSQGSHNQVNSQRILQL